MKSVTAPRGTFICLVNGTSVCSERPVPEMSCHQKTVHINHPSFQRRKLIITVCDAKGDTRIWTCSGTYVLYFKRKRMTKRLEGHSNWYYHYKHNLLSNRHECLRNELFCNSVPSDRQLSCRKPVKFSLQWTRRFHFSSVTFFTYAYRPTENSGWEEDLFFFLSLNRHALLLNRQRRSLWKGNTVVVVFYF